jgi:hypothetical protein
MSELYSRSSKRSGDVLWLRRNVGVELKGEAVIGYEANVPLERGDDRTAERAGEGVGEAQEGGASSLRLCAVILLLAAQLHIGNLLFMVIAHITYVGGPGTERMAESGRRASEQSEKNLCATPKNAHLLCWEGPSNVFVSGCTVCECKGILTALEREVGSAYDIAGPMS